VPNVTIGGPGAGGGISTTDAYIQNMRRLFSKPGKRLVYSGRGSGATTLIVDPPASFCGPRYGTALRRSLAEHGLLEYTSTGVLQGSAR
jgi:hypothetical protein